MKPRNSTRRRRFECEATTFPVATWSAANSVVCAMPFVIMALAGQGTAVWQLQIALRPFQGLDRRLFIDAQNDRLDGRAHIETDNVGGFRRKVGIVALAPGL